MECNHTGNQECQRCEPKRQNPTPSQPAEDDDVFDMRDVAATAYQCLGAAQAPVRVMDYFAAIAHGAEIPPNPLPVLDTEFGHWEKVKAEPEAEPAVPQATAPEGATPRADEEGVALDDCPRCEAPTGEFHVDWCLRKIEAERPVTPHSGAAMGICDELDEPHGKLSHCHNFRPVTPQAAPDEGTAHAYSDATTPGFFRKSAPAPPAEVSEIARQHSDDLYEKYSQSWFAEDSAYMKEAIVLILRKRFAAAITEALNWLGNSATVAQASPGLSDEEIAQKWFPDFCAGTGNSSPRDQWTSRQMERRACLAAITEARQKDAQRIGELERAISSWKAEELVWRQSDQEHRIKAQQMQAGAEALIEKLAHEKARHNIGGDIFEAERNRMILNQTTELKYLERAEAAESRADALEQLETARKFHETQLAEWKQVCASEVFQELKHGQFKHVLHLLQDGEISVGKAAEAIAEIAHCGITKLPDRCDQLADDQSWKERADALAATLGQARETLDHWSNDDTIWYHLSRRMHSEINALAALLASLSPVAETKADTEEAE